MRVYVAGKFQRANEVQDLQTILKEAGHTITHDWTREDATGMEGAALDAYLETCALADLRGVRDAHAVVLIHDDHCRGGFWEAGAASVLDKILVVVGASTDIWSIPIFYRLPTVKHVKALDHVLPALAQSERNRKNAAGARPPKPRA